MRRATVADPAPRRRGPPRDRHRRVSAMLELARVHVPDAEDVRRLALPDDPVPAADAIVSVGHVLGYLPDESAAARALTRSADALGPAESSPSTYAICGTVRPARAHRPGRGRLGGLHRDRPAGPAQVGPPHHHVRPPPRPDVATKNATLTCWSTRRRLPICSHDTGWPPPWRPRSGTRRYPRGWWPSSDAPCLLRRRDHTVTRSQEDCLRFPGRRPRAAGAHPAAPP